MFCMNADRAEDTCAPLAAPHQFDGAALVERIRAWGAQLGFARIGIAGIDVAEAADRLRAWLARGSAW